VSLDRRGQEDEARLLTRWAALVGPAGGPAGLDLLARYAQPHRRYHTVRHLTEVLDIVDELAEFADDADAVRLAAWFHDAIYEVDVSGAAGAISNEEASALLAESVLRGSPNVAAARLAEVLRLIRMTERHSVGAGDRNGAVLSDADLAILGAGPARYEQYAQAVREEYEAVPEDLFSVGRAAVLRGLLDESVLFRTPAARARYEERARENMRAEIARLAGRR
jgi:predicted metal-dependent HD superfamily phosphohydrolase